LGMSTNGDIIGEAYDNSGNFYPILWEPIPEPASALLIGAGILFTRLRRRQR
jgi:hypothetical protein